MKLLAIETSTEIARIALQTEQGLWSETLSDQKKQAQSMLPLIQQLMEKAHIALAELDGIIFGRGPGSFTGLRIACSMAKGLAYALEIPLYPVSTLAAIAQAVRSSKPEYAHLPVLSIMDARMQEWYWACYPEQVFDAEEQVSASELIIIPHQPYIAAGTGFESLAEQYQMSYITQYPEATAMIELVEAGCIKAVSAREAQPLYVRNTVTQGEKRG